MKSQILDSALRSYLETGSLKALLPHRDDLAAKRPDPLHRMAGAELSLWLLDTDRAAAHLDNVVEVRGRAVRARTPLPEASDATPNCLLGALFTTAAQLQYRHHAHWERGLRLCDLAERYFARDREPAWFWIQKNEVTRCRLLYRNGDRAQAERILRETDQRIRLVHGEERGRSGDAIDVVLGIANEIRASIAATAGDLESARVLIMESLVSLAERDPVRHAYAYLSAARIYSALGGENARMAIRYAELATLEFAEYGHAFEARARNQRARCLVALGHDAAAEEELERARGAIGRIENDSEVAFASADLQLSAARLDQSRARTAKTAKSEAACWARVEKATSAALSISPVPDRIGADAQIRQGEAILKLRPRSKKGVAGVREGIARAEASERVRLVAIGHLVLAEHFHATRRSLEALTHLELAQEIADVSSTDVIDRWASRLAGQIDQPVRVEVRGRTYKEVMGDFQVRLKDYYVGKSGGSEERFRALSGLGRSEFFRASERRRQ